MPRFSLVMCTRGRMSEVEAFMESLLLQDRQDYELIIVDQNQDDRLVLPISRFSDRFPLRHIRIAGSGAARARNIGLDHATGELIGFPDDDCRYLEGYLDVVDRVFIDRPDLGGLTGQPTTGEHQHSEQNLSDWENVTISVVSDRCQEFTIFLRSEILGASRYNERMGVGASTPWGADEGPELLIRLMQAGCTIQYFPRLFVYHPDKILAVSRQTLSRAISYARGRGCLLRLHHFPLAMRFRAVFRPAAGCFVYLALLKPKRSVYYLMIFAGTLRGLLMSKAEMAFVQQGATLSRYEPGQTAK